MADEQTLNRIMNEYEELRISAANERKKRIEKVNKKIPRVAEIDREIFQCGMENTKRIFKNPDKADEYNRDFKENLRKLENEKSNLLKVNGISADYNNIMSSDKIQAFLNFFLQFQEQPEMEHFLHAVSQIPGRRFFLRTVPALPDQLLPKTVIYRPGIFACFHRSIQRLFQIIFRRRPFFF